MINKHFDAMAHRRAAVEWIKEWFEENGKGCNAIIGISGGKDSSVAAALCVEALGEDRVIGVLMPNGIQRDIHSAYELCEALGIQHVRININYAVDGLYDAIDCNNQFPERMKIEISEQTKLNLPPRIRMATLYAIAQSTNGRVCCTDNFSESYIGYSTRWGDNVGDFAPLASLTSEEVVAVGEACGLPKSLTQKIPEDGLTGKTDEDMFGFSYDELNSFIRLGVCQDPENEDLIMAKHDKSKFKTKPIPCYHSFETVHKW